MQKKKNTFFLWITKGRGSREDIQSEYIINKNCILWLRCISVITNETVILTGLKKYQDKVQSKNLS